MPQPLYRSILLPLDGSPFAEQAIPLTLELAKRAGAMVQVALVHHPVPALATALEVPEIESQLDQEARAREQVYLSGICERMRGTANVPVTSTLHDGAVTEALQEYMKAVYLDPTMVEAHFKIATIHRILNNYDEAIKSYNRVIALDPTSNYAKDARRSLVHIEKSRAEML